MDIKPLICPQCGGEIKNYFPGQTFATCGYCGMQFVITPDKQPEIPVPVYQEIDDSEPVSSNSLITVVVGAFLVIAGIMLIAGIASLKNTKSTSTATSRSSSPTPAYGKAASATPNPNLLEFGGKGDGNGLFKDANSIAIDSQGRIYVSDDSLRVQQFDDKGTFIKSLTVPAKTGNYDHARTIDKIAVGDDGKLYVAVGGVMRVYNAETSKFIRVMEMAPDYISDFALKSDGGMDMVYDNDRIETLIVVTRTGKITKRVDGFHTKALDAAISPQETAVAAIRLAVDGAGNIFSVYAFGDLGSYSISSNNDELLIARFTPEGKFVSKFVESMTSCGIAVDTKDRIYVSAGDVINLYSNVGELQDAVTGLDQVNAFALDKDNNIYILGDNKVIKRPAVQ